MLGHREIDIILSTCADWEQMAGKTVLVTGANGRLGIYIAQSILAANDRMSLNVTVILLARSRKKLEAVYGKLLDRHDVYILEQDVRDPIRSEYIVDYIFHTAGLASPEDFTHRPIETLWGHVQGTKNILDYAAKGKMTKVLYVSTIEVYGARHSASQICEDDMGPVQCMNYRACYPEAKRLCETMLACYQREYNLNYVVVRLSHTLGPGISLDDGRAFAEFLRNVIRDEDIVLQSSGSAIRTYTYTADAVGGMFLAMLNGSESSYNIASVDNKISILDLAKLIAGLSTTGNTKVRFAQPKTEGLAYLPFELGILDCKKIQALGWNPQVTVDQIFRWTLDSFVK